jgi:hypothetical protein
MDLAAESFQDDAIVLAMLQLTIVAAACWMGSSSPANSSFFDQHLCCDKYCEKHTSRGSFKIRLRMHKHSFDKLLLYGHQDLLVNETIAKPRGGAIIPELCLYCTLRWLAGGSYLDICDIDGIFQSSFYRVDWKMVRLIARAKELAIRWPHTMLKLRLPSKVLLLSAT